MLCNLSSEFAVEAKRGMPCTESALEPRDKRRKSQTRMPLSKPCRSVEYRDRDDFSAANHAVGVMKFVLRGLWSCAGCVEGWKRRTRR
eukprot:3443334-Rhodomonas_salina.1